MNINVNESSSSSRFPLTTNDFAIITKSTRVCALNFLECQYFCLENMSRINLQVFYLPKKQHRSTSKK